MSKQIYWAAVPLRSWGKKKLFPMTFHKTATHAKMEVFRNNTIENKYKNPHLLTVKRFMFEVKDEFYYDVYEHHYEKIEKVSENKP